MTVAQLIEELKALPAWLPVVIDEIAGDGFDDIASADPVTVRRRTGRSPYVDEAYAGVDSSATAETLQAVFLRRAGDVR